jgi:hypothetical protein
VLRLVGRLDREFDGTEVGLLGSYRGSHVYRVHSETVHQAQMGMGVAIAAGLDHTHFGVVALKSGNLVMGSVLVEKVEKISEYAIQGRVGTCLGSSTADTVETTATTV